jgi:hypothetical protein
MTTYLSLRWNASTCRRVLLLGLAIAAIVAAPRAAHAQGAMTNGDNHSAAISAPGEVDTWTFTASQNDSIVIAIGEVLPGGPDPGFVPWIRLQSPMGVLLSSTSGTLAAQISVTAPLTGTYTVLVASADAFNDATGAYRLTLAKTPGVFTVPPGDEGGAMTNGQDHQGAIHIGDLDMWTFTAAQNDYLAVSIGEPPPPELDPGFNPWIRLIGPTGVLLGSTSGTLAAQIAMTAPLSGTYTVIVGTADAFLDGAGSYRLTLAKGPGAFVVPTNDTGGTMTIGRNHGGSIYTGDLDVWSFTAAQNDYIALSVGEPDPPQIDPGFNPWIRLIGPTGVLLGNASGARVAQINVAAPLSGTYTVIVGTADAFGDASGEYLLTLAKAPGTAEVPIGDQGGALTNGLNHLGHIHEGDLDQWTFTAAQSDYISLSVGEPPFGEIDPGFNPWIRLLAPNGQLIGNAAGALVAQVHVQAPLSGTYTVLIGTADAFNDGEGDYRLTLAKVPGTASVPDEPPDPDELTDNHGGPLTNGVIHDGNIRVGDLDQWTFTAAQNEYISVSIGEPQPPELDPGFNPWIRLVGPTGVLLGNASGARVAQISLNAPLSGTYTVIVGTADAFADASGLYKLTLAKAPGTIALTPGDQGGLMTNLATHEGSIYVGDLDIWTFTATQGRSVTVSINEPPPGEVDPGFNPWIRLVGPTGVLLQSTAGAVTAQFTQVIPLTGLYTVIVGTADAFNDAAGSYRLSVTGADGPPQTVTPSAGPNGSISPNTPQQVPLGSTISFTITPAANFVIAGVSGTCGGTRVGQVFTTAPITGPCTVHATFSATLPTVSLDKTSLRFGAVTNGAAFSAQTGAQLVRLTQSGAGAVTWTAVSNRPWLQVSPAAGTGPATLSVGVGFVPGLIGAVGGAITFTFTGAANNPGPISIAFNVIQSGTSAAPFGNVDTPTNNRTGVTGAVPFTGWSLDDVGLERVAICRSPFGPEVAPANPVCGGAAQIFLGFAVSIDGARPDVAAAFPNHPANTQGGWGFMVLTNMLPNQGNGTYLFHIYAQDREGTMVLLGTRTMTCANSQATLPFGAIDTPGQGGVASTSSYLNFGWALTPQPKTIPTNGSTITVLVDGLSVGTVSYNHFRSDIATLFPGYNNTNGAIGFKVIDTTTLANGTHTIVWVVTDNQGATQGIGSRFFTVSNGGGALTAAASATAVISGTSAAQVDAVPLVPGALLGRRGWDLEAPYGSFPAAGAGRVTIRGEEIDRFEVVLGEASGSRHAGYLRAGAELWPLPIGSTLNPTTGVFTWAPGVGFVGNYDLVFVRSEGPTAVERREVRIVVQPKGRGAIGPQVVIDVPKWQQDVPQPFMLAGWAADLDAPSGTGVSTIHAWAYPLAGGAPIFLGAADYGGRRPDVATAYGEQFRDSGYGLFVNGLVPGNYDVAVFAASTVTGGFVPAQVVRVTVR